MHWLHSSKQDISLSLRYLLKLTPLFYPATLPVVHEPKHNFKSIFFKSNCLNSMATLLPSAKLNMGECPYSKINHTSRLENIKLLLFTNAHGNPTPQAHPLSIPITPSIFISTACTSSPFEACTELLWHLWHLWRRRLGNLWPLKQLDVLEYCFGENLEAWRVQLFEWEAPCILNPPTKKLQWFKNRTPVAEAANKKITAK